MTSTPYQTVTATWHGLVAKRAHLRNCCVEAAFTLSELLEAQTAHDEALACLKKVIALDPVNEAAYGRMMELHARRGDGDCVRAVFADCRRALENLIDAAPSAKSTAVFEAAMAGSATHNWAAFRPEGIGMA
jgi:DNA-binding SARP family transcriptional activator